MPFKGRSYRLHRKTVGRPKKLDRQKLINIAFDEYWKHGIDAVPVARIAQLANISRPGIYKEFRDEDNFQSLVLEKYTNILTESILPFYNNPNSGPELIYQHAEAIIQSKQNKWKYPSKNNTVALRPKGSIGCLYEKTNINLYKMGNKTSNIMSKFRLKRLKIIESYIKNNIKKGLMNQKLNEITTAKYIEANYGIAQNLAINGTAYRDIKNMINIAFMPLVVNEQQYRI